MRPLLVGIVGLVLVGFCLFGGGLALVVHPEPVADGLCDSYLQRPKPRWLKLQGCRLQVDQLLVGNAEGVERFSDRAEGVSRVLHASTPVWTQVWAPVATGRPDDRRPVRVVYRLNDPDLLEWINAVERADEAGRARLLEKQTLLLRVATPGLLMGRAERSPEAARLQEALGTQAQAGLLVVEPGPLPEREFPLPAFLSGVTGGLLLVWTLFQLGRRSGHVAPGDVATVDVSKVPVALGELDALRQEEAEERRRKKTRDP